MAAWTSDELRRIEAADELRISSIRPDDTLRSPVTIWVVRHGDDLYVRSVNGRGSAWFRGIQDRQQAQIEASGVVKDVQLVETDDSTMKSTPPTAASTSGTPPAPSTASRALRRAPRR
jgi:hypothetical protein